MNRKIDDLGRMVIPKEMRDKLNIKTGDELKIELVGKKIMVSKANDKFDDYLTELYEMEPKENKMLIQEIYKAYKELG